MPNCFSLTRKGETTPTSLITIDQEICEHLKQPCHPKYYSHGWYDTIGFSLAVGKSFDDIAKMFAKDDVLQTINTYLSEHFTSDCWAEIGR